MMASQVNRDRAPQGHTPPIWRQILIAHVEHRIKENPAWVEVINEVHRKLLTGFFDDEHVDALGQKGWGAHDFYDAYAFAQMHSFCTAGEMFTVKIEVGEPPYKDREVAANNRALSHLPSPFKARFRRERHSGADGQLVWKNDIVVSATRMGMSGPEKEVHRTLPPDSAPLEVGYTDIGKSCHQLLEGGRLARWPYGSTWITLFYLDLVGLRAFDEEAANSGVSSKSPREENGEISISSSEVLEHVVRRWPDLSEGERRHILRIVDGRF